MSGVSPKATSNFFTTGRKVTHLQHHTPCQRMPPVPAIAVPQAHLGDSITAPQISTVLPQASPSLLRHLPFIYSLQHRLMPPHHYCLRLTTSIAKIPTNNAIPELTSVTPPATVIHCAEPSPSLPEPLLPVYLHFQSSSTVFTIVTSVLP